MKQVTSTGNTVDEAVESALSELKATKDRVEITVLDGGKKGLFGVFGTKPAIVKVTLIEPIKVAKDFLLDVIEKMGIQANIEEIREKNDVIFKLSGEKIAILIGKRGQTLNSLQYLTQLVANRNSDQFISIMIDAENYRERRKETLEILAKKLANKSIRTKNQITLEPMPSFERKIIHTSLYGMKGIKTYSEGKDPNRHIVIAPSKE